MLDRCCSSFIFLDKEWHDFPFCCSNSLFKEHEIRCFERFTYIRVGWLGSPSKCSIF